MKTETITAPKISLYGFEVKPSTWGEGQSVYLKMANGDHSPEAVAYMEESGDSEEGGDRGEEVWVATGMGITYTAREGPERDYEGRGEKDCLEWLERELIAYYSQFIKITVG
jgi:hypothetical protein